MRQLSKEEVGDFFREDRIKHIENADDFKSDETLDYVSLLWRVLDSISHLQLKIDEKPYAYIHMVDHLERLCVWWVQIPTHKVMMEKIKEYEKSMRNSKTTFNETGLRIKIAQKKLEAIMMTLGRRGILGSQTTH